MDKISGLTAVSGSGLKSDAAAPFLGGSKFAHFPLDQLGADKGAGVAGSHRPGDMTGTDKAPASGHLPTFAANPVVGSMNYRIAASLLAAAMMNAPPGEAFHIPAPAAHQPYAAPEREPEAFLPETASIFPLDMHEVGKIEETPMQSDSGGGGAFYLPLKAKKKTEDEELQTEEAKEEIVVDEAFSWRGHTSEFLHSPEKRYTNPLSFVSSMLLFPLPPHHQ